MSGVQISYHPPVSDQARPGGAPVSFPDLWVIRHGETEWNRAGRFQGALDSPLTDLGQAQARAVGAALTPFPQAKLYSSPQGRALATAALAFPGVPIIPDDRLVEIGMGDWSGLARAEIDRRWPGPEGEDIFDLYARCPGGEPHDALWDRVSSFLADLTGPAVIVTHGFTSRFLRAAAMGLSPRDAGLMPGGHGVIHHLAQGQARLITAPGLPAEGRAARPRL
jgi:glucosyl-3-phosphoglycerate phosphatase